MVALQHSAPCTACQDHAELPMPEGKAARLGDEAILRLDCSLPGAEIYVNRINK